jgi:Tol biopolymer transport system component/Flp pilus assembly protein TadD
MLDLQPEQAAIHARRVAALDGSSAEAALILARAYIEMGDQAQALDAARTAVQLDANNAEARAALAEAYLLDGQTNKAVEEANLALVLNEKSAESRRIRGRLYLILDDDLEQAIREFQMAADLQPGLWLRHHELGLLLREAGRYDEAILALTDALVLRHKPATYTAIGETYYLMAEYDRAASFLEQSLSAGARDARTYALLSVINARGGRCDDASIYVKQALALDADNELASQAQEMCQESPPTPSPSPAASSPPQPTPTLSGQIAFPVWNSEAGKYDTYVAATDGSGRRLVVEEMHQPAFSPDGQWLAVNGERRDHMNLFIVRPDGSDLTEITENIEDSLPCWSPDGKMLAFSSTRHSDRKSRLYIVDSIPFEGGRAQGRLVNSDLYEVTGEHPAWLPDGRIVYTGCDYRTLPARCGLFLISAEPGPQTPQQLTTDSSDSAPAASGSRIAFMSERDGNWEIYVVNDAGSGLKRLTNSNANDGLPTWSPDGEFIATVSDEGGTWAVWVMRADGSARRKLFDIAAPPLEGGGGLGVEWWQERIAWGP